MNKFAYRHPKLDDAIESGQFHDKFYDKAVESVRQHSDEVGELVEMIALNADSSPQNLIKMAGYIEKIKLQYDYEFERMVNEALCDDDDNWALRDTI